jgi:hypothetical protein
MDDIVAVPHVNDMEDDIFHQHADLRHGHDFMAPFVGGHNTEYTTDVARACHDFWHRERPDEYDHEHLEET